MRKINKQEDADYFTQYSKSNPMFVQTFKILGLIVPEKSLTQISLCLTFSDRWKRNKLEREGKINISILFFFYTLDCNL